VYDTANKTQIPMVIAPGYDGGPFWSPDGSKICYRSDRAGTDLLQIYVSEVERTIGKHPSTAGVKHEFQLTTNEHVNWGPFWHPSGEFLVYATSEIGHRNYEVFALQVGDLVALPGKASGMIKSSGPAAEPREVPTTVALARASKRVTFANGADVLPAFRPDGQWMMWTAQRGELIAGETRPSSQLWMARWNADPFAPASGTPAPTK
jgi:TolB protein